MDQPGSRYKARHTPLIIERPDLDHPVKRVMAVLATSLAWGVWLAMFIPFVLAVANRLGFEVPEADLPNRINLLSVDALLCVLPHVFVVVVALVLLGITMEKIRVSLPGSRERWRPLGMERLATGEALDAHRIAEWQSARIMYVEHGPLGRVTKVRTTPE